MLWNQLFFHHCMVLQLRKGISVWDWIYYGPHILIQLIMGRLLNMALFIYFLENISSHINGWSIVFDGQCSTSTCKCFHVAPVSVITVFFFILWGLMNDVVCIKLCQFVAAIVRYLFPNLSFILLPIIIWYETSHGVYLGDCFLVPFPPCRELFIFWLWMTFCPCDQQYL